MADRRDSPRPATDVLVFTKRSAPGGVERIALRLSAAWRSEGLVVTHIVPPADRDIPEWLEMLQLLRMTRRSVRESRPKVLFCPGNAYTVLAVLLKLSGADVPIVAKISNDLRRPDMPRLMRPLYRMWLRVQGAVIDEFAALSPAMASEIVELMDVPRARVHVVPNPVLSRADIDEDAGRPLPATGAGRRFVAVGRLEVQKNFPLMLRAFATGSEAGDTLAICGEGRERATLELLAKELGIASRVRFTGFCDTVRDQLARHDILLLSSVYEGQPGVVVEALSVGLGVIATRCCAGLPELLEDGALGCLVPRGDHAAFAGAIAVSRAGTQDRAHAGAKAAKFTIEAAMPAYAVLFATAHARYANQPCSSRASSVVASLAA